MEPFVVQIPAQTPSTCMNALLSQLEGKGSARGSLILSCWSPRPSHCHLEHISPARRQETQRLMPVMMQL